MNNFPDNSKMSTNDTNNSKNDINGISNIESGVLQNHNVRNSFYEKFLNALGEGDVQRITDITTGDMQILQNGKVLATRNTNSNIANEISNCGISGCKVACYKTDNCNELSLKAPSDKILNELIKPEPHLFVFGAGHVSKALYDLAVLQGMKITVADERCDVCTQERFPLASRITMPYKEILKTNYDIYAPYYVVVTHGHSYDSACLEYALCHSNSYIGMIGSKAKVASTMEKMRQKGFSQEQLEKVHSPIGLKIGAVTPEEIAISIMAEIISVFRTNKNLVTIDPAILRTMAYNSGVDVRIVEKHGSAPRSVGSQLFVEQNGTLHGTIGGGAIEKTAIEIAKQMMKDNTDFILKDFSLDTSSDLGMICGGQEKVIFTFLK